MKPNDLLNTILMNCDQFNQNGISSGSVTEEYKKKIPILCDMAQREIIEYCKPKNEYVVTLSKVSGDGFRTVELPPDYFRMISVLDKNGNNWYLDNNFCYISGSLLYVVNDYEGDLTMVYLPQSDITTLDSAFVLDVSFKNALIFYCSANLIINDDAVKANFYLTQYNELLPKLKTKDIIKIGRVVDVYKKTYR